MDGKVALSLVSLTLALGACGKDQRKENEEAAFESGEITPPPAVGRTLSWHADVKPIVEGRCATCHYAGGPAPFELTTYEHAETRRAQIRSSVAERRMPPFLGLRDCAEYKADWSLTEEQRGIVTSWVDQGAPEGDPAVVPPALTKFTTTLSRTDVTLAMPEPYTPKQGGDDMRCIVLDWPKAEPGFVTGISVDPYNLAVVHHVIVFMVGPEQAATIQALDAAEAGPGYSCFGGVGSGNERATVLGTWIPGVGSGDYPEGSGMPVPPGAKIVLQMHYNTSDISYTLHGGKGEPDQTSVRFRFDSQVAKVAGVLPVVNPAWVLSPDTMMIPADREKVVHSFEYDPTLLTGDRPFEIRSVTMHQHVLGTRNKLTIIRGGQPQCLVDIPRWDFGWQLTYELATPLKVLPGDLVKISCEWDNSAANQPILSGVQRPSEAVTWGEGTKDEMCLAGLFVTF